MQQVYVSAIIDAPLETVWKVLRDFNALPAWHPLVAASLIEENLPADAIGCIRNFQLNGSGETIREQLLALSDIEHFCTYSILEAPLHVSDYVATVRLRPITTTGQTFGEWQSKFNTPLGEEVSVCEAVRGIYEDGFASIAKR
ncbi:MAG: SRPBCC family protein [Planctomycetaceae bacterium]|nr:SRPBCC family protein [Planctomycetales bacterium]MCB9921905.1 SRPBCC family protein [Planctomycetaceae bacterium]